MSAPPSTAAAAASSASSAAAGAKDAPAKDAPKGLDDDKDSGKPLKLSSKDKREFVVERKHAFISTLVKTSLENGTPPPIAPRSALLPLSPDVCPLADDKAEEVPILGVTGAILELVVNYMKEHKGPPRRALAPRMGPLHRIFALCCFAQAWSRRSSRSRFARK